MGSWAGSPFAVALFAAAGVALVVALLVWLVPGIGHRRLRPREIECRLHPDQIRSIFLRKAGHRWAVVNDGNPLVVQPGANGTRPVLQLGISVGVNGRSVARVTVGSAGSAPGLLARRSFARRMAAWAWAVQRLDPSAREVWTWRAGAEPLEAVPALLMSQRAAEPRAVAPRSPLVGMPLVDPSPDTVPGVAPVIDLRSLRPSRPPSADRSPVPLSEPASVPPAPPISTDITIEIGEPKVFRFSADDTWPDDGNRRRSSLLPDMRTVDAPTRHDPAPLPPAGWYPDPRGAAALRWWSGTAWTDDVHHGLRDAR